MIVHEHEQRSDEWFQARAGIPTASEFHRIITPGGKPSRSADGYMAELVAESILGPLDRYSTGLMERGSLLEDEAVAWYEFHHAPVQRVGLVTLDDGSAGCSPDGLVGEDGGLEIKCYAPAKHVLAALRPDEDHKVQIQGSLWLTGRKWWDRLYWHPRLEPVVTRHERDEEYIEHLAAAVRTFCAGLAMAKRRFGVKEKD